MALKRSLMKDFFKLLKTIDSFSDGQARVLSWSDESDDDEFSFQVEISPSGGPYYSGKYIFKIATASQDWPNYPPTVTCQTLIFHPNIEEFSEDILSEESLEDISVDLKVCISILDEDEWNSTCYSFDDCVQAVLFVLHTPNFDDPLSPYLDYFDRFEMAKLSVKGGQIESGPYVPKNAGWRGREEEGESIVPDHEEPMEIDTTNWNIVSNKRDTKLCNQRVLENFYLTNMHEIVYEDPGVQTFEFYQ
ncbi:NEDD8-conjugating enzyme Ubc12-like [Saccostrea echinata]|uniref:NEDD8-conjugating enzyme Ubc12-like n=1 Tax=Saccostrea echinata TaxID=191078 RepID=UPI002A8362B8|nr:NEDD8-conjugating enzyme Ubc12-like [Saccostrea echinata]